MKGALLAQIAVTFATLSLVAIGGANTVVPDIHRQVVDVLGWMDNATFASLFAIAQVAPGPNVLIVSLIGWHVAGAAGLAVATLAMIAPSSLLAYAVGRFLERTAETAWIATTKAGLVPIAIGLVLASGTIMAQTTHRGVISTIATAATVAYVLLSDRNPLWALAGGAALSLAGLWIGLPT